MNLRDIKKDIEYVLSAFVEDCSVCAAVNPNASEEEVASLLEQAITLYNDLRDKVNVKVEGSKKTYYNQLRKEILEETDALYTKLSEAVKKASEPKEEEKVPVKKAPVRKAAPKKAAAEEAASTEPEAEKKAPAKKAPAKKAPAKKAAEEKVEE